MKKIIAVALSLCIIGGALPIVGELVPDMAITASAETTSGECGENITWTLDDEGTLTISGTGAIFDYSIWDTQSPFSYNSDIKTVYISHGITNIGKELFYECRNITSVTMTDSVKTIGDGAFEYCENLTQITLPDSIISIGSYAFRATKWLKNRQAENPLVIVNGILIDAETCIGDVTIPNSVTSMSEGAFSHCENIKVYPKPWTKFCNHGQIK